MSQGEQQQQPRSIFARLFNRKRHHQRHGGGGRFGSHNLLNRAQQLDALAATSNLKIETTSNQGQDVRQFSSDSGALVSGSTGGGEDVGEVGCVKVAKRLGIPVKVGYESSAGYQLEKVPGVNASTRTRKVNQDAYCVHAPFDDDRRQMFVGVFDGHGMHGSNVSQKVRDVIPKFLPGLQHIDPSSPEVTTKKIREDRRKALSVAFESAEKVLIAIGDENDDFDHCYSGTTAVCLWLLGREAYCAWSGDSRCVIGRLDTDSNRDDGSYVFRPVEMSDDHKPTRSDEQERVKEAGGRILRWRKEAGPLRVWVPDDWIPGLAMTRSIGDTLLSKYGVIPAPDVTHIVLTDDDMFMVLASDGIWEFLSNQEVVSLVGKMRMDKATPRETAKVLVQEAVRRWRRKERVVDDITVVVIWLDYKTHSDTSSEHLSGGEIFRRRSSGKSTPSLVDPDGNYSPFKRRS